VVTVQLRRERPGFVPICGVTHNNIAIALNSPRLLVDSFGFLRLGMKRIAESNALDVSTEVPNLIKSVPGWHLQNQAPVHIRDVHRDVEQVLFGMGQRYRVLHTRRSVNLLRTK
jgi:hypothetical protein